jgi:hypothetical protein
MAGTYTHFMVVEKAIAKLKGQNSILEDKKPFVLLGAVSPDLPYLTDMIMPSHSWSDRMHYENINMFIKHGVENLLELKDKPAYRGYDICYAWLFGYVTHVLTDSVVHPVVNSIVGPYRFNQTEHRNCEMVQDSLIFKRVMGNDLIKSKYHHFLTKVSTKPESKSVRDHTQLKSPIGKYWKSILKNNHSQASKHFGKLKTNLWYKNYMERIGLATRPNAVLRHVLEKAQAAYKSPENINQENQNKYFYKVIIPNHRSASFVKVFQKAVEVVTDVWGNLQRDIDSNKTQNLSKYIKNWDLDSGLDMNRPDMWSV